MRQASNAAVRCCGCEIKSRAILCTSDPLHREHRLPYLLSGSLSSLIRVSYEFPSGKFISSILCASTMVDLPKQAHERTKPIRATAFYLLVRILAAVGLFFIFQQAYTSWGHFGMRVKVEAEQPNTPPASYPASVAMPKIEHGSSLISPTSTKAIIAASMRGDNTTWIEEHFPDWHPSIFVMDDANATLTVTRNGGHEASAYLTFIINNYYSLPDYMVFLHARRYQWHNDDVMYDHVPVLKALRLSYVGEVGYHNLRCNGDPGCPVEVRPNPGGEDGIYDWAAAYGDAWEQLWPGVPMPLEIGAPCCAQFAVSRTQVLQRTVRDYERVRQWLWTTHIESYKSGRIMEYTWHIMFGQDAVACPSAQTCYCAAFGACELDCPSDRWCNRRWWQPAMLEMLPEEWPAKEFQGNHGWPTDGWWLNETLQQTEPAEYLQRPQ